MKNTQRPSLLVLDLSACTMDDKFKPALLWFQLKKCVGLEFVIVRVVADDRKSLAHPGSLPFTLVLWSITPEERDRAVSESDTVHDVLFSLFAGRSGAADIIEGMELVLSSLGTWWLSPSLRIMCSLLCRGRLSGRNQVDADVKQHGSTCNGASAERIPEWIVGR